MKMEIVLKLLITSQKNIIDYALAGGHEKTFEFLIDHDFNSTNLLNVGINQDNVSIIRFFIKNTQQNSQELMFQAAKLGSIEIIKYLASIVEDINTLDEDGNTLLHIAIELSNKEISNFLFSLENSKTKIDTNPTNPKTGQSSLHHASSKQDYEMLTVILSAHNIENSNETVWDFMTIDFLAPENDIRKEKSIKNPPKFIDLNQKDMNEDTPLIIAAREGDISIVKTFLSIENYSIEINSLNKDHENALLTAVKKNRADVVSLLIEKEGMNLNQLNKNGFSALHITYQNKNFEISSLLIHSDGVDVNIKSRDDNSTPLHICSAKNYENDSEKIVDELLKCEKSDINIENDEKMTPLHLAAKEGNRNAFIKLLNRKESRISDVDMNGLTILHSAARFKHFEICKMIISKNLENVKNGVDDVIDVNQKDGDGWTPLHYAV